MVRNLKYALGFAGVFSVVLAHTVAAQACLGVPINSGAYGVEGQFGLLDGAKGYGAQATANLSSPLALQGGYTLTSFDEVDLNMHSVGARVGAEIPNLPLSLCPVVGADYSWMSVEEAGESMNTKVITIPVGVGFGKTIALGSSGLTIFGVPQFLRYRATLTVDDGTDETSLTGSTNEFGGQFGFRLGTAMIYGGASAWFTSIEDSEPVYQISVGFVPGGRGLLAAPFRLF